MSHSKAAASPIKPLEITLAGPPKTPPRGTKRTVVQSGAQYADTPNAMRRPVSLPQSFDMVTINMKTTTEHMRVQTGRDLVTASSRTTRSSDQNPLQEAEGEHWLEHHSAHQG